MSYPESTAARPSAACSRSEKRRCPEPLDPDARMDQEKQGSSQDHLCTDDPAGRVVRKTAEAFLRMRSLEYIREINGRRLIKDVKPNDLISDHLPLLIDITKGQ